MLVEKKQFILRYESSTESIILWCISRRTYKYREGDNTSQEEENQQACK